MSNHHALHLLVGRLSQAPRYHLPLPQENSVYGQRLIFNMTTEGGNWKDLLKAAGEGNIPLIRYHLQRGVDPNFQHPEYFTCPIFEAIRNGHLTAVNLLVEEGKADPTILEEHTDQTPMEVALETKNFEIADYLNSRLPPQFQHKFRNVLVTGGTRGIGKAIVEQLLNKGHRVVFVCRRPEDGTRVRNEVIQATSNHKVDYLLGDLSSIQSTLNLAKSILSAFPSINVLIHNAGIWPTQQELNVDGLETSFCVNYLSQYLLTRELIPLLKKNGPDSRIVFVSGKIYKRGNADVAKTPYGKDFHPFQTYMHTKQCGAILFLNTARKLEGSGIIVNAVHPGVIRTGLGESKGNTWSCIISLLLRFVKSFWKEASQGALGPVWLAESRDAGNSHGNYYDELNLDVMDASVTAPAVQRDWEQWTIDFLHAREERQEISLCSDVTYVGVD